MSPEIWVLIFFGLLCLSVPLVLGLIIALWSVRLRDLEEIYAHGIATEATIRRTEPGTTIIFGVRLTEPKYCVEIWYRDFTDKEHYHKLQVSNRHPHYYRYLSLPQEGSFKIYYSMRRPQIWAFAEDIERMRELRKQ